MNIHNVHTHVGHNQTVHVLSQKSSVKTFLKIYQEVYAHQQQSLAKINAPANYFKLDSLKLKAWITGTIKWIIFGKCDQTRK